MVGHSLIYIYIYLISICKKLIPQQLWKYCEICCVNIIIYMPVYINVLKKKKTQTDYWEKKKTLGTVEINVNMLWT